RSAELLYDGSEHVTRCNPRGVRATDAVVEVDESTQLVPVPHVVTGDQALGHGLVEHGMDPVLAPAAGGRRKGDIGHEQGVLGPWAGLSSAVLVQLLLELPDAPSAVVVAQHLPELRLHDDLEERAYAGNVSKERRLAPSVRPVAEHVDLRAELRDRDRLDELL